MKINELLRKRRVDLGMSMKELADRVGVSEGTISRWESGKIEDMKRSRIKALSDALHISPAVIMEWEEPDETDPYYMDSEAAAIAQDIFKSPELRVLFDAARDVKPEDLQVVQSMVEALRRKEQGE